MTAAEREDEKGAWSVIFGGGLGLYSMLVIGGVAMQATQMLVIAIVLCWVPWSLPSPRPASWRPVSLRDAHREFG